VSQVNSARRVAIVGPGRVGRAFAASLRQAGYALAGPLPRDYAADDLLDAQVVLLCVPDREIQIAARALFKRLELSGRCPLVGHCSGASTLEALFPIPPGERFSLHPLMSVTDEQPHVLDGCAAAVAAGSDTGLSVARQLAESLGMHALEIDDADRAAYHAAASIASNFLVTLESAAERIALSAGCDRQALVPLIAQTVSNWAAGGQRALTGPIARGDEATVERQRRAVAERAPELLELFDSLARATRALATEAVAA
jgi:predicted short-subunit dehydrogenase-like oxidoreductase (DUF2520 family)